MILFCFECIGNRLKRSISFGVLFLRPVFVIWFVYFSVGVTKSGVDEVGCKPTACCVSIKFLHSSGFNIS